MVCRFFSSRESAGRRSVLPRQDPIRPDQCVRPVRPSRYGLFQHLLDRKEKYIFCMILFQHFKNKFGGDIDCNLGAVLNIETNPAFAIFMVANIAFAGLCS